MNASRTGAPPRRFGLVGHPLGHSLSAPIHGFFLSRTGAQGSYTLYDTRLEELPATIARLREEVSGFNCTIPYKQAVLPLLDALDPSAAAYGAVNTVRVEDGGRRLVGHNTDAVGFHAALRAAGIGLEGGRTLVLGAGGVARMMAIESARTCDEVWIAARSPGKAQAMCDEVRTLSAGGSRARFRAVSIADLPDAVAAGERFDRLLQGTPVGMWPETGGMPVPESLLDAVGAVYDTIYNPLSTRLVLAARRRGIPAAGGLRMLVEQGAQAFRIWNPDLPDPMRGSPQEHRTLYETLRGALLQRSPVNLVLTGFMGSGETTVGKALASRLQVEFLDLDRLVEERCGMSVPQVFETSGESVFRRLEREALESLALPVRTRVVATGGGALLAEEAVERVREGRGLVVLLDASIGAILKRVGRGEGRPLLRGPDAEGRARALLEARMPGYRAAADVVVDADGTVARTVGKVLEGLGLLGEPRDGDRTEEIG